jgi:hypothetical protein
LIHLFLKAITRQYILLALCFITAISFCWSKHLNSIPVFAMAVIFLADKNIFLKLKTVFAEKKTWLFFVITIWYAQPIYAYLSRSWFLGHVIPYTFFGVCIILFHKK